MRRAKASRVSVFQGRRVDERLQPCCFVRNCSVVANRLRQTWENAGVMHDSVIGLAHFAFEKCRWKTQRRIGGCLDEVLLREQSCRSARSEIHDSLHSKEKRERERERERERCRSDKKPTRTFDQIEPAVLHSHLPGQIWSSSRHLNLVNNQQAAIERRDGF